MKTLREYIDILEAIEQGVSEQRFMIYFVVPDVEDYDDHHEPEERTIIVASNRSEAIKKFQAEIPGAYIKDIYPMEGQQGVSEGEQEDPVEKIDRLFKNK